jgi:hypothetical protein
MNFSSAIERCFARNPALAGFVYSDANSAGVVISNVAVENAIRWCKVQYDAPSPTSGQFGIWVKDTNASGRVTDGYCIGNVVTGAGDAAIRIERAAGWFIEHNHAYLVEQDGMFFSYVWSSYIHHNEVDHFGMAGGAATYWGMRVESVLQNNQPSRNGRPSTFDHNIVSTDESKGGAGTTYRYFRVRNATGTGTGIVHFSHNTAHRDAVGPGTSVAYDFQSNGGVLDIVGGFNVADGPSPVPVTGSGTLNQQAPSRILYAKSQPIAVGVNGSYGSATTFTTESFSLGIVPTALALIWGGSFSAGETANAQVVAGYSDGSTNTVTFGGVTSDGTQSANDGQRFSLYKDGLYLTSLAVSARTTASSTAVTLTTEIAGFNAN